MPATFLFTGREARNHPKVVEDVLREGHEVGCHTMYHETVGVATFNMPGENFILDSEVRGRLALATDTVESVAGIRPVSFRAPRLFGSTAMINTLEDLGYVADASFPAYYSGLGFLPYRPSREDWSKEGNLRILELPNFYDTEAADSGDKNRGRDQWPMLRLKGPEWFVDLCRRMLRAVHDAAGRTVLCVYMHPWEFVPMPGRVATDEATILLKPFLYENCGDYALGAFDQFLAAMKHDGVSFLTMKELAAAW